MYDYLEDVIKTGDKVKVIKMVEDDIILRQISIGSVGTFIGADISSNSYCICIYFDGIGIYYVNPDMIEKVKD